MQYIPVRRCFWEALETALEAQTHRLARDIAAALQMDETPLLKSLRQDRISAYLFDDSEDADRDLCEMRCKEIVPLCDGSPLVKVCNAPVVWPNSKAEASTCKCLQHTLVPSTLQAPASGRLDPVDMGEGIQYYLDSDSGALYSADGGLVGRKEGEKILLFEEETD